MTLRLGVVGCGSIAEHMHVPAIARCPEVRLTAVVDADGECAQRMAAKWGADAFGTRVMDVQSKVDAVVLCTPPHVRPGVAEEAFTAGLHVMCEKPFANSVSECDQIIRSAARYDRKLAVAHVFRFWPSRKAVRDIIETQEFGDVDVASSTQGSPYSWTSVTGYNMRRGMVPGGVLFDAGIHPLDTLMWWFGKPKIVDYQDDSLGGLESNVRLTMSFGTGPEVRFRQSRTAPMTNEFRIRFARATVALSNYAPRQIAIVRDGRTVTREVADASVDHRVCEDAQLLDFVACIAEDRAPAVTGQDARGVIELIESCYERHAMRTPPSTAPLPGLTR